MSIGDLWLPAFGEELNKNAFHIMCGMFLFTLTGMSSLLPLLLTTHTCRLTDRTYVCLVCAEPSELKICRRRPEVDSISTTVVEEDCTKQTVTRRIIHF